MNKKTSFCIGLGLLIVAVIFLGYVFNHPEASFPWGNRITFLFYGAYVFLLFRFLVVPFFERTDKEKKQQNNTALVFGMLIAFLFLLMELFEGEVNFYTGLRGFIIANGVDDGIKFLYSRMKAKIEK